MNNSTTEVAKDKNGNYEGHSFNLAMLEAQLSGNHIKVMLAYLNVGGFDPAREVFVTRQDYERFGMVRQTFATLRTELVEAGWLAPCNRKSTADYDLYTVQVGGPVAKRDRGCRKTRQGVSENATAGVLIHDTEVTTEVTKGSNEVTNKKEQTSTVVADAPPVTTQDMSYTRESPGLIESPGSSSYSSGALSAPAGRPEAGGGFTREDIDQMMISLTKSHPLYAAMTKPDLEAAAIGRLEYPLVQAARQELLALQEQTRQAALSAKTTTTPVDWWERVKASA
jgi:hypothetical protein